MSNLSRLEYFAAHCPDSWVERAMPKTIGDVRDELIKRKIIPESRAREDVLRSYNDADYFKLLVEFRYDYAELMIMENENRLNQGWES